MEDQHVHVHLEQRDHLERKVSRLGRQLSRIEAKLDALLAMGAAELERDTLMELNFDDLKTELDGIGDVADSIDTVVTRLLDEVAANSGNQTVIDQLVEQARAEKDQLIASALRGTPADPDTGGGDTTPGDGETPTP